MILLGSRALRLRAPGLLSRPPKDFDFLCYEHEFKDWLKANEARVKPDKVYREGQKWIVEAATPCEFELIEPNTSSELLAWAIRADRDTFKTSMGLVPSLDMLFTLKKSHRYLKDSPHFWKTALDYHRLKAFGAKVRPEWADFVKLREKETYARQKHPKLNVKKNDFFRDDGLTYVYDHDTIHLSVAIDPEKPAYTKYMRDGQEVNWDRDKFFALPEEVRLQGVVEEAAVLAIERSLVPHPGVWTPEYAWRFALSKVCTSITSGAFREYAFENVFQVLALYPKDYWDKFQKDVESGLVRKL